jgi:hypothetical protein
LRVNAGEREEHDDGGNELSHDARMIAPGICP